MKRAAIWLALAVVIGLTVDVLGDMTQDRPDRLVPGSRTDIVVELRERSGHSSELEAAQALWSTCLGTVHNELVAPGLVALGSGRYLATTEPAVGRNGWRRLKGCLQDLTVDQVLAEVVSKTDRPPPAS